MLQYREVIGLSTLVYGPFEKEEVRLLCEHAKDSTTAIDVGANIGVFTIPLAKAVGQHGSVMAFEPLLDNVRRLKQNIELNMLHNVQVYAIALGSSSGSIPLQLANDPAYPSTVRVTQGRSVGKSTVVQMASLDDIWHDCGCPTVSVIKVDVEGAEMAVLMGSERILSAHHPALLIEAPTPSQRKELLEWLAPRGYVHVRARAFMPWNNFFVWSGGSCDADHARNLHPVGKRDL